MKKENDFIQSLINQMTLKEKASMCSGKDCWNLPCIKRLGFESIMVSDGPHGLRKQEASGDNLGIGESVPAVCFPTASAIACSFDRNLVYEVGKAIGEECFDEEVDMILGPGINMKRSPLCGRNFEYYSEDPVAAGELGASMIEGIQSTGTGACLKHFAVNNQEKRRMSINAVVDERTLRELYLKPFEIAVKKARPEAVMCSYNKLNGVYNSENKYLLTTILRKEWGFKGAVISDWGAVHDRVDGIKAGMDLEMPGNNGFHDEDIINAVKSGALDEKELDRVVHRVLKFILRHQKNKKSAEKYDKKEHHELAVYAAAQSAVLLKNEGALLPAKPEQNAAVIGAFAKKPRYQGAGSSKIHPIQIDTPWDALMERQVKAVYASGYQLKAKNISKTDEEELIQDACKLARGKEIVYIFAGLTEGDESEGFDRTHMRLPEVQNKLIERVSECNKNVVVILMGGAPVELPWLTDVKAVLLTYLGGEGVGTAIAKLLLGEVVPSGKLAETWPLSLMDNPSAEYFPGGRMSAEYKESIYTGYRYYEKADKAVQFPFGYGLSYVKFQYSDLVLEKDTDKQSYKFGEQMKLHFSITNMGKRKAKETAFLFVRHENEKVFTPIKELKNFIKVTLEPGETKEVSMAVDTSEFGYYNTLIKSFYAEPGEYEILVGPSVNDCPLKLSFTLKNKREEQPDLREKAPSYYELKDKLFEVSDAEFETLYGKKLPEHDGRAKRPFSENNTLDDISYTLVGKLVNKYADHTAKKMCKVEEEQAGMMAATIKEMPFFALASSGEISKSMVQGIIDLANRHIFKGIHNLLK